MDQLERRLADRLTALGEGGQVPPGLAGRVRRALDLRRRRRRGLIVGVALGVAMILMVPAFIIPNGSGNRPSETIAPSTPVAARQLVDAETVVAIPRKLPSGSIFQVQALAENGTVIGVGISEDGEWDPRPWQADPQNPGLAGVDGPRPGAWSVAPAVAGESLFWVEARDEPGDLLVVCTRLQELGAVHDLGDSGMLRGFVPVLADRGTAVWTDGGGGLTNDELGTGDVPTTVWAVAGCDEKPYAVTTGGHAVAFTHPDVFVRTLASDGTEAGESLMRIDVGTGEVVDEIKLPQELIAQDEASPLFAANAAVIVWTDGQALTVVDRRTGASHRVPGDLPTVRGANGTEGHLTAGARFIAYSSRPISLDGPSYSAKSVLYDTHTGMSYAMDGVADTAREWLLWEEGDGADATYYIGRVQD